MIPTLVETPPFCSKAEKKDYRCEISLVLRHSNQLFENDLPLPAEHVALSQPVLDFLEDSIEANRDCSVFDLKIYMPQKDWASFEPRLVDNIAATFDRYFNRHIQKQRHRLSDHFRQARKMFVLGFAFMMLCMLVRTFWVPEDSSTLMSSIREGLLVIGWVAMWKPVEELIFNWWPIKDELRLWESFRRLRASIILYKNEA